MDGDPHMSDDLDIELVHDAMTREIRRLRGVLQRRAEAMCDDLKVFLTRDPKSWHFYGSQMESARQFDRAMSELDGWIQAAKLIGIENP